MYVRASRLQYPRTLFPHNCQHATMPTHEGARWRRVLVRTIMMTQFPKAPTGARRQMAVGAVYQALGGAKSGIGVSSTYYQLGAQQPRDCIVVENFTPRSNLGPILHVYLRASRREYSHEEFTHTRVLWVSAHSCAITSV